MEMSVEQLSLDTIIVGERVRVSGVRGEFVVVGRGKDGSVTLYGGPMGKERFRSFSNDRLKTVKGTKSGRAT